VHSIDSTHMMYTALACSKQDVTFASVHDSYWSHACDVTKMNKILREEFVRLHSSPLIEELDENFRSRYPQENFPKIPHKGKFDLENVK
jgi:DNA-directed RNA polymerase, mitochondrial